MYTKIQKKYMKNMVTLLAIMAAFLCGIFFQKIHTQENELNQPPPRIFIEQLKTKMNIRKNDASLEIYVNGEKMEGDINLLLR